MIYVVDIADDYYPSGGGLDWVLVTRDLEEAKQRVIKEVGLSNARSDGYVPVQRPAAYQRLWVVETRPGDVTSALVIWESPTAPDLLDEAKNADYRIRGPYSLDLQFTRVTVPNDESWRIEHGD